MQNTEVGIFSLEIDGKQFTLLPSFRNMAKLADSTEILTMYSDIHNPQKPDWLRGSIGYDVISSCCDDEDIIQYLIECQFQDMQQKENTISLNDQVTVGAALMRHGVAGVNRPDYEGSKKDKGKAADKFDVNALVADAVIHFGLRKSEALDLTMTEFCYLLASKFPPDKKENNSPSLDDHKAAMKALMENK